MSGVLLVCLLVLQQHDSNGKIKHEERADNNTEEEVDLHEGFVIGISVHVGHVNPAFQGDTLEDCYEC